MVLKYTSSIRNEKSRVVVWGSIFNGVEFFDMKNDAQGTH